MRSRCKSVGPAENLADRWFGWSPGAMREGGERSVQPDKLGPDCGMYWRQAKELGFYSVGNEEPLKGAEAGLKKNIFNRCVLTLVCC